MIDGGAELLGVDTFNSYESGNGGNNSLILWVTNDSATNLLSLWLVIRISFRPKTMMDPETQDSTNTALALNKSITHCNLVAQVTMHIFRYVIGIIFTVSDHRIRQEKRSKFVTFGMIVHNSHRYETKTS